ncbi:MAG: helix-turn-helix transcriptional regulator [Pseudomonadota bacterium]
MDWRTRLRGELERSGKTRSQVCQEAGLNPAYITQILEQKAATPRIDNLSKLASVLGTTVSYIVEGVSIDRETAKLVERFTSLTEERKSAVLVILEDLARASEKSAA